MQRILPLVGLKDNDMKKLNKRMKIISKYLAKNALLVILATIFFASCQNKDEFIPDPVSGEVADFYIEVQDNPTVVNFSATEDFVYVSPHLVSIHIPANSIVGSNNMTPAGDVQLSFEGIDNKGQRIVHENGTMNENQMLTAPSTIFFSFTQDDTPLAIRPGSLITVRVNQDVTDSDMVLYESNEINQISTWASSSQSMTPESWSFFWDGKNYDGQGYELLLTNTGWYTIAKPIISTGAELVSDICVELPVELYDERNSNVYMILDDYDTVVPMHHNTEKMLFCATLDNLPSGTAVTFISVSSLGDGNFHFGTTHASIRVEDNKVALFPEPKTKNQILDLLGMF